jgi:hypothetical protein
MQCIIGIVLQKSVHSGGGQVFVLVAIAGYLTFLDTTQNFVLVDELRV